MKNTIKRTCLALASLSVAVYSSSSSVALAEDKFDQIIKLFSSNHDSDSEISNKNSFLGKVINPTNINKFKSEKGRWPSTISFSDLNENNIKEMFNGHEFNFIDVIKILTLAKLEYDLTYNFNSSIFREKIAKLTSSGQKIDIVKYVLAGKFAEKAILILTGIYPESFADILLLFNSKIMPEEAANAAISRFISELNIENARRRLLSIVPNSSYKNSIYAMYLLNALHIQNAESFKDSSDQQNHIARINEFISLTDKLKNKLNKEELESTSQLQNYFSKESPAYIIFYDESEMMQNLINSQQTISEVDTFNISALDFCALIGSNHCFKTMLTNGAKPTSETLKYALLCGDTEIIQTITAINRKLIKSVKFDAFDIFNIKINIDICDWLIQQKTLTENAVIDSLNNDDIEDNLLAYIHLSWFERGYVSKKYNIDVKKINDGDIEAIAYFAFDLGINFVETTVDEDFQTALHVSVCFDDLNMIKLLIEHGININLQDTKGSTALHIAVKESNIESIKFLIENGIDVTLQDNKGRTAWQVGIEEDNIDIIKVLIEKGVNANCKITVNDSIHYDKVEIIELLLKSGININNQDTTGRTALHISILNDARHEIIKLLLERGIDVNLRDTEGKTALQIALEKKDIRIIKLLIKKGINININTQNAKGETALHILTDNMRVKTVKLLLEKGANVNIQDTAGLSALHTTFSGYGSIANKVEVIKLLIGKGINVNLQDNNGNTIFHYAARILITPAMEDALLSSSSADLNIKNNENRTCIDIAKAAGNARFERKLAQYSKSQK